MEIKINNLFIWFTASLQVLIQKTMIKWAEEDFIDDQELVREMFSLLHRQYHGIGEVRFYH